MIHLCIIDGAVLNLTNRVIAPTTTPLSTTSTQRSTTSTPESTTSKSASTSSTPKPITSTSESRISTQANTTLDTHYIALIIILVAMVVLAVIICAIARCLKHRKHQQPIRNHNPADGTQINDSFSQFTYTTYYNSAYRSNEAICNDP
ncbi:uncharacterized protein LOC144623438 [Crassostrea virginica]